MEHRNYANEVAGRVSAAIDSSGRSLRDVAEASGLAIATLSRKKNGYSPFDVDEVYRIATALGVEAVSLYPEVA